MDAKFEVFIRLLGKAINFQNGLFYLFIYFHKMKGSIHTADHYIILHNLWIDI